jgi:hypothetical protein
LDKPVFGFEVPPSRFGLAIMWQLYLGFLYVLLLGV